MGTPSTWPSIDFSWMALVLLGALLLLTLTIVWRLQFRWHWYVLQYLYFLRFPLISAALLVLVCFAGVSIDLEKRTIEAGAFHNMFVMEPLGIGLTTFLAVLSAWTTLHAAGWVYAVMPNRVGLPFAGYTNENREAWACNVLGRGGWMHCFAALLAGPLIVTIVASSEGALWRRVVAVLVGLLCIGTIRVLLNRPWKEEKRSTATTTCNPQLSVGEQPLTPGLCLLDRCIEAAARCIGRITKTPSLAPAYRAERVHGGHQDSIKRAKSNLLLALGVTVFFYVLCGLLLWPYADHPWLLVLQDAIPALAYVLLLQMLLTWLLSALGLWLDGYRIPVEMGLVLLFAGVYMVFDTEHYYSIPQRSGTMGVSVDQYAKAWSGRRHEPTPIVVAASGGGITAAVWTATVLAGLERELGGTFSQSVALISSTSGGSVGAMYYVDSFAEDGSELSEHQLSRVVQLSARSSIAAVAWGSIYPDFLRLFLPYAFHGDRATAIEQRWAQPLEGTGIGARTLRDWQGGVEAGWRPAAVFNAMLVENGARYRVSPLKLDDVTCGGEKQEDLPRSAVDFAALYPDGDLSVVTAARLSATFPYVTPVARPDTDRRAKPCVKSYHVADGGYFDNLGIMTVIDFAKAAQAAKPKLPPSLVIEIRASGPVPSPDADKRAGFRMETLGPLEGVMAMRSTSQVERADLEMKLLRESSTQRVTGEPAVFELRVESPLSWHLSDREKRQICAYWFAGCADSSIDAIARHLGVQRRPREIVLGVDLCESPQLPPPDDFDCPWLPGKL